MKFKDQESADKLRGGYYTPRPITDYLVRWALAAGADSVLEPSCGDGAFLESVLRLSASPRVIHGVELDPYEARKASEVLGDSTEDRRVFAMDFLRFAQGVSRKRYDAVVGNPPYVRYQYLSAETQSLAQALYASHGLPFTKHLNAWAPFIVDSLDRLAPGGRLAMVVPAELLNVIHAGGIREFLLRECAKVLVIDPQELLFREALQGTVLLLAVKRAEGEAGASELAIRSEYTAEFLSGNPHDHFESAAFVETETSAQKWMHALLRQEEREALARLEALPDVHAFRDVADVSVGIVTGANSFFLVNDETVDEFQLHEFVQPMFGRSFHVPGVIYSINEHRANVQAGVATNFLRFGDTPFEELPSGAQRYIRQGEALELHLRYKCRIREPWYNVPSVWASPLGLLKRSHAAPRLIMNSLGALTTDTAYRVQSDLPPGDLAVGFYNSLTSLTAEMAGRAYGGGVLELVPSEIRKLLFPVIQAEPGELERLNAMLASRTSIDDVMAEQDARVLVRIGATSGEVTLIQSARRRLMGRRLRDALDYDELSRAGTSPADR